MLLIKQRNELFELINNKGLQHNLFGEINAGDDYFLTVKNMPFMFGVRDISESVKKKVSSKPYVQINDIDQALGASWRNVVAYFADWLSILKDEISTPDLWAEAQANSKLFALDETVPDEMFSATELRHLEGQVRLLSQQLAAIGLPAQAQEALTATIEEIPKKATRLTKEEVRGWFMSAIVTQVTTLALSPEHLAAVGQLLKTTFMGLLQLH